MNVAAPLANPRGERSVRTQQASRKEHGISDTAIPWQNSRPSGARLGLGEFFSV